MNFDCISGRLWPGILACAALLITAFNANGASVPQFRDYPAASTHRGNNAPVVLGAKDVTFRSRLRAAARKNPNFAGSFVLETWGCGASCLMGAAINAATGQVVWLPFSICCATPVRDTFNAVEFRPDSRLIVFAGLRNEEGQMGAHFYEFDGHTFRFITTVPNDGTFGDTGAQNSAPLRHRELAVTIDSEPTSDGVAKVTYENSNCHMDACNWFALADRTFVEITKAGTLVLATVLTCETVHRGGKYPKSYNCPRPKLEQFAAFCSKTSPSLSYKSKEGWQRTKLIIGDEGVFGYTLSATTHYLRVCHDLGWDHQNLSQIGARFGYAKSTLDEPAQDTVSKLLGLME